MCGIAGLTVRAGGDQAGFGAMLAGMITALEERGPDSAGAGIYSGDGDLEVMKDVGPARAVCERAGLAGRAGYQGVGHTRMATESAVTRAHSHPFVPAPGVCVVHNGSFSNHATVRRELERSGTTFDSDNDSEVAARYIASRLAGGDDLAAALGHMTRVLDGFYTLVVTTPSEFAVVRDAFACKPAVVAETRDYVAMASEYRALADLPGVRSARVFEPQPGKVQVWTR
jgi:glutamate synthase domain-containing protein 1